MTGETGQDIYKNSILSELKILEQNCTDPEIVKIIAKKIYDIVVIL